MPTKSKLIAKSWKDPAVRAARSVKLRVKVGDQEFRSLRPAFEAFGLPLAKLAAFRVALKASGRKQITGPDGETHRFRVA